MHYLKSSKSLKSWVRRLSILEMTHRDFCKDIGIKESLFSQWIKGVKKPLDENIKRVDKALDKLENENDH